MDVEEAIRTRRSISQFEKREVDKDLVKKLVEAAGFAPSSCNTQPWRFLLCDTPESRNKLNEYIDKGYKETAKVLREDHKLVGVAYEQALSFFEQYGKFDNAPVLMVLFASPYDTIVFSQMISMSGNNGINRIAQDSVKTSTAMAMQNFILAAHNNGLGTRVKDGIKFMMNHPNLRVRFYREFDIPKEYELVSGIQLGYPTAKALQRQPPKRKPLGKIVRYV